MNHELPPPALSPMDQGQLLLPPPPPNRFSSAAILHGQLHRWVSALRKRWWVLLLTFLLIGGPAVFYAATKAPTYKSQATMWLTSKLNLPGGGLFFSEGMTDYLGTQAELLKSAAIQSRAFKKIRPAFPDLVSYATNHQPNRLPFAFTVTPSPKSSVLELEASGPFPDATRAFLDAVMDEYLALKKGVHQQASSGALASLTGQIKGAENQIRQQQQALTAFAISNNLSSLTEHGLTAGSRLAKLDEVLSDLRTEYRLLDLLTPDQFKDLSRGAQNAPPDATLPGNTAARALAITSLGSEAAYYRALEQFQLLKAKRAEFAKVLRPTHSKMIKLDQEISGLEQLLKALKDEGAQQTLAQMVSRKTSLALQIDNLETQYRDWQTNSSQASAKLVDYDQLKLALQRSQALYDRLVGLLQTVDLGTDLDQEPLAPLGPASAGRPTLAQYKIATVGLFLAFVTALGLLFLLELMDDRFTSVEEASLVLPIEVVGQVPESRLLHRSGTSLLLPAGQPPGFAEAFRNLRSSLLLLSPDQSAHPRVVLVSSAVPKEGKTTVAVNLASTLALSGSRVLLVDADFRRGSIHRLFGLSLKPGLLEVLNQTAPPGEAIVPTSQPNLFILPAGDAEGCAADFFLDHHAGQLLRDLAAQYDYIVIDTAPVLAADEAVNLGPMTDGVYLVVRDSYTSSRVAYEAANRLHLRNVKILGVVYNRAHPSTDHYSRYSREYSYTNGRTPGGSSTELGSEAGEPTSDS